MRRIILFCLLFLGFSSPALGISARVATPGELAVQTITVVNQSHVPRAVIRKIERAVAEQSLQLRYWWGTARVRFGQGGWPLYVRDYRAGDVSAMHQWHAGHPFAVVTTEKLVYMPFSVLFSHEVLEMLVDPRINRDLRNSLVEVADPVAFHSYWFLGERVSDFALARWFTCGRGPYDQMRTLRTNVCRAS